MGCFMSRLEIEADGRTYRMRKLIASGGFSQIYEADDIEKSTKVAVKKMICHSKSDIDRVRREVDVHRRFQGAPHIISLLGVAEDEFKLGSNGSRVTMFSLIFPLCRSGSVQVSFSYFKNRKKFIKFLKDELDRRKTPREFMDEGRVLLLLRQLCSALEMLHDSNPTIAHR
jgi:serine/threonine protein kinase